MNRSAAGIEGNAHVYAFTLFEDGTSAKVADIATGMAGVMGLDHNVAENTLRAFCDDTCSGTSVQLAVSGGAFTATRSMTRPSGMGNLNNEGVAIAPQCISGLRSVLFADDGDTSGYSLRRASLTCA